MVHTHTTQAPREDLIATTNDCRSNSSNSHRETYRHDNTVQHRTVQRRTVFPELRDSARVRCRVIERGKQQEGGHCPHVPPNGTMSPGPMPLSTSPLPPPMAEPRKAADSTHVDRQQTAHMQKIRIKAKWVTTRTGVVPKRRVR